MEVGERLRTLRESRGLTLEQVAQYMGVNRATILRYETGNIDVRRNVAAKLAECYKTTPSYIMGWTDVEMPAVNDSGHSPEAVKFAEQFSDLIPDEWRQVAQYADFLRSRRNNKDRP